MSARASRAPAPEQHGEPRAGHARRRARSRECRAPRPSSQCGFGVEVERRRRAPAPHFDVVGRRLPHRHALVRQVRQRRAAARRAAARCSASSASSLADLRRRAPCSSAKIPLGSRPPSWRAPPPPPLRSARASGSRPSGIRRRRSASSAGQLGQLRRRDRAPRARRRASTSAR